jgi:hypothetical protein
MTLGRIGVAVLVLAALPSFVAGAADVLSSG